MLWVGLWVGLTVGAAIGFIIVALLTMASDEHEFSDRDRG